MNKLRILHLEDNANDAFLIALALQRGGLDFDRVLASHPEDFIAAIHDRSFDLILLDDGMPGFNGQDALVMARELQPTVPVIFVSGAGDEKRIANNLKNGARDHILKDKLSQLPGAIMRVQAEKISKI